MSCCLRNIGALLHSVPLGSVQTYFSAYTHILLPRQFRCVPFSQRVLLAVLLADESEAWRSNRTPYPLQQGAARRCTCRIATPSQSRLPLFSRQRARRSAYP